MYKILIVEDDKKIERLVEKKLEQYGYEVTVVTNYSDIRGEYLKTNPHVILMDINLPNFDGFFWCREIRKMSKVPILFISARFSDMDQVMAIESGGDDYIIKPFSFEVLLAKIKSVIRRTYGEYSQSKEKDIYEIDGLYLYMSHNVVGFQGKEIELSKKEFALLYKLAKNVEQIVNREELLEELWDEIEFVDDNTLSVNVTRLRRKLEDIHIYDAIETKRGQGYLLSKTWVPGDLNEY